MGGLKKSLFSSVTEKSSVGVPASVLTGAGIVGSVGGEIKMVD